MIEHAPFLAVAFPLLAAFLVPMAGLLGLGRFRGWFALAAVALSFGAVLAVGSQVYALGPQVYTFGAASPGLTLPSGYTVPVRIIFEVDAMSVLVALMAAIISLVGIVYSFSFFRKGEHGMDKYWSLLLLMAAGMYGMAFTGDLFNLFVFLEVLSITSCGLVAFYVDRGEASEAAFKYLLVSSVAGLFVLMAAALLYGGYDALNIAALAAAIEFTLVDKVALALLFAAFAMKAGAVPMHMWVPDAYSESPAPVTLMLVAATLVSLYALFRVVFTLFGLGAGSAIASWALIILGIVTMFVGVTMAIPQKDINRLIAYHSVSQIGYMLLGVGVGLATLSDPAGFAAYGSQALEGGIFHMLNYVLYKGLLFLAAGVIIYRIGTRNLDEMSGLAHRMPLTTGLFALASLAIAGVPPLNGFVSKWLIYESVYLFNPLLSIVAMVVSMLTLASFVKVFQSAFLGPAKKDQAFVKEAPAAMVVAMLVLAALIIVLSLFPDLAINGLIKPAGAALADQAGYIAAVMGGGA